MTVTVCIGSSCYVKGSRQVVEILQRRIQEHGLEDKVNIAGMFCMGKCQDSVCVMLDDRVISVSPEEADAFFETEILNRIQNS